MHIELHMHIESHNYRCSSCGILLSSPTHLHNVGTYRSVKQVPLPVVIIVIICKCTYHSRISPSHFHPYLISIHTVLLQGHARDIAQPQTLMTFSDSSPSLAGFSLSVPWEFVELYPRTIVLGLLCYLCDMVWDKYHYALLVLSKAVSKKDSFCACSNFQLML